LCPEKIIHQKTRKFPKKGQKTPKKFSQMTIMFKPNVQKTPKKKFKKRENL